MKKRRIKYSELGAQPPKPEKRVSTPVELARALAAAREREAVEREAVEREAVERAAAAAPEVRVDPVVIPSASEESAVTAEFLLFTVGHERCAVPLSEVEEAVDLPAIHFVPEMPAAMLGVISLRGMLVPVYSPSQALGQPLASRRAALIFRVGARYAGVVVDDVDDATIVGEHQLRELPAGGADDLVVGVMHHEGHLISVMRGHSLVSACREGRATATA